MKILYLLIPLAAMIGCKSEEAASTALSLQSSQNAGPSLPSSHSFLPSTPSHWINSVQLNGFYFGHSSNTRYDCVGGGGTFGAYPNTLSLRLEFYDDGTVYVLDPTNTAGVYDVDATVGNPAPASGGFARLSLNGTPAYILGPVNYPGISTSVLDASNHVTDIEIQTYLPNSSLDSGSIWSCSLSS